MKLLKIFLFQILALISINASSQLINPYVFYGAEAIANAFEERVKSDGGIIEAESCLATQVQILMDAGFYDKASLILTGHGYKEGKLYSLKPSSGSGDFSFSRAGTRKRKAATYVEEVPYNLLQYSEQFDNAAWSKTAAEGITVSANAIANPLTGLITADKLNEDASNGNHYTYQLQPLVLGERYTVSVYAKAAERSRVWLYGYGAATAIAHFNLATGTLGTVSGTGTPVAFIEALSDGWHRCVLTYTPPAAGQAAGFGVTTTDNVISYIGTVGSGAYFFGAQNVLGTSARDYFATTNRQNVPALDFTGSTCPSLSLEPARTNLLFQSEAFDNASWSKTNTTVTANATVGPENLSTADALLETTANGLHYLNQLVSKAGSVLKYTATCFVKPNGRDWVRLTVSSGSNGAGKRFNVATGTVGSTQIDGTGFTLDSWNITPSANGFYRIEITVTSDATTTIAVNLIINSADGVESYVGDVTKGLYYYGAQLEQASYATSYIKTEAATVSRVADAIPALTGVSNLIGQTEGTLYFEGSSFADGTHKLWGLGDGTTSNVINIGFLATNVLRFLVLTGGVVQASIENAGFTSGTNYKMVGTYKGNKAAFFVNGVKIGEDLTVNVPLLNKIAIGDEGTGSNILYGNGKAWVISKVAISDSEAINLTTP